MSTGQELHHAELFPAINMKAFTVVGRGGEAPAVLTQIRVTKEREREIKGKYTLGRAKTVARQYWSIRLVHKLNLGWRERCIAVDWDIIGGKIIETKSSHTLFCSRLLAPFCDDVDR